MSSSHSSVRTLLVSYLLGLNCSSEVLGGSKRFRFNKWNTTNPLSTPTCLKQPLLIARVGTWNLSSESESRTDHGYLETYPGSSNMFLYHGMQYVAFSHGLRGLDSLRAQARPNIQIDIMPHIDQLSGPLWKAMKQHDPIKR